MIEFAAALYAIETLLGWAAFVIVGTIFIVLIYQNYKFERERDRRK